MQLKNTYSNTHSDIIMNNSSNAPTTAHGTHSVHTIHPSRWLQKLATSSMQNNSPPTGALNAAATPTYISIGMSHVGDRMVEGSSNDVTGGHACCDEVSLVSHVSKALHNGMQLRIPSVAVIRTIKSINKSSGATLCEAHDDTL